MFMALQVCVFIFLHLYAMAIQFGGLPYLPSNIIVASDSSVACLLPLLS